MRKPKENPSFLNFLLDKGKKEPVYKTFLATKLSPHKTFQNLFITYFNRKNNL